MPIKLLYPSDGQDDSDSNKHERTDDNFDFEFNQESQLVELPQPFKGIIEESVRLFGVHADLPTLIALATISAAIGKSFILEAPPHKNSANLHSLNIAPSGSGKSLCYRLITRPFFEADTEGAKHWNNTVLPKVKAKLERLIAEKKKLLSPSNKDSDGSVENDLQAIIKQIETLETQMQPPRLIADDVTSQKLGMILQSSFETIAVFSSEAGDILSNIYGRNNAIGRTDEHLFLKGFSLESIRVDRVSRPPIALENPCITVCWTTTPDELIGLFSNPRFVNGGLLPRFLICQSRSRPVRDDGSVLEGDLNIQDLWGKCINDILNLRDQKLVVKVSPEAKEVFRTYHNKFADLYELEPESASFNARRREIAQRIALVIHVGQFGREATRIPLDESTAELGCQLSTYYGQAHQGFLRQSMIKKDDEDIERIAETARSHGEDCGEGWRVSLREVKRRNTIHADRVELLAQRYPKRLRTDSLQLSKKGGPRSKVVVIFNS